MKALNTSYEILSFRNIIDLYRANNFSLIGVNLINVPVPKSARKELDFTGAYVLRKDISLYPNAIAVDEIICSKKFHKNNSSIFSENSLLTKVPSNWGAFPFVGFELIHFKL